jgi:hypothetical protein
MLCCCVSPGTHRPYSVPLSSCGQNALAEAGFPEVGRNGPERWEAGSGVRDGGVAQAVRAPA